VTTNQNPQNTPDSPAPQNMVISWVLNAMGAPVVALLIYIGGLATLIAETTAWVWRSVALRRVRLGRRGLYTQITRVGIHSMAVIALVSGCIGVILALQMAPPLDTFGATDSVATIVAIAVVRELGPLISAIVLTGFAGASIAAELGTMVVGEEIEALEAHALNPIRFLVVPRLIATTISMVILSIFAIIVAIGGGHIIGVLILDITSATYYNHTVAALDLTDVLTSLWKAGVFGLILGAVACYNGLKVTGGAAGVGRATTYTVVHSIVLIVISDLIFVALFYRLGWT
tara:strand:- start:732 stop:1595 length:864 start_codon:yes stop_codon:yes gene_type:complete